MHILDLKCSEVFIMFIDTSELTRYVICYDILNDKRRKKLTICLQNYGNRIQASVFEALLNTQMLQKLATEIKKIICIAEDSVYMYPIRRGSEEFIQRIGTINYPIPVITNCYVV
jgi:CRISPR-associated protein Cas2